MQLMTCNTAITGVFNNEIMQFMDQTSMHSSHCTYHVMFMPLCRRLGVIYWPFYCLSRKCSLPFMFINKKNKQFSRWNTSHCCSGRFPQDGLLGFWCSLWRHSCRSERGKATTGAYSHSPIFKGKRRKWGRWWW